MAAEMAPEEIRAIRKRLGLSQAQAGDAVLQSISNLLVRH